MTPAQRKAEITQAAARIADRRGSCVVEPSYREDATAAIEPLLDRIQELETLLEPYRVKHHKSGAAIGIDRS